jgi:hypothetical protein
MIRRKSDGLFSTGGTSPTFNGKGKQWKARNHVTSHMKQVGSSYSRKTKADYYHDCEVVTFEVVMSEVEAIPALEWKESDKTIRSKELQEIRRKAYDLEYAIRQKQRLEAELAELTKRIG